MTIASWIVSFSIITKNTEIEHQIIHEYVLIWKELFLDVIKLNEDLGGHYS